MAFGADEKPVTCRNLADAFKVIKKLFVFSLVCFLAVFFAEPDADRLCAHYLCIFAKSEPFILVFTADSVIAAVRRNLNSCLVAEHFCFSCIVSGLNMDISAPFNEANLCFSAKRNNFLGSFISESNTCKSDFKIIHKSSPLFIDLIIAEGRRLRNISAKYKFSGHPKAF